MNKYRNKKTTVYGITFDSEKEANRFLHLMMLEKQGIIKNLHLQEEFTLQNAFQTVTGEKVKAIKYKADFTYWINGEYIIEDVKGFKTKEYQLKKKMAAAKGWFITEV